MRYFVIEFVEYSHLIMSGWWTGKCYDFRNCLFAEVTVSLEQARVFVDEEEAKKVVDMLCKTGQALFFGASFSVTEVGDDILTDCQLTDALKFKGRNEFSWIKRK